MSQKIKEPIKVLFALLNCNYEKDWCVRTLQGRGCAEEFPIYFSKYL